VLDGEIVIATPRGLDFDALQLRLHPAASGCEAAKGRRRSSSPSICSRPTARPPDQPQEQRRALLEQLLARVETAIHLTPMTRDRSSPEWLCAFEAPARR